jgi:hypothetical protein
MCNRLPLDPSGQSAAREARISIREEILDGSVAKVRLYREYNHLILRIGGSFPAHDRYQGDLQLTWVEVASALGPTGTVLGEQLATDGGDINLRVAPAIGNLPLSRAGEQTAEAVDFIDCSASDAVRRPRSRGKEH